MPRFTRKSLSMFVAVLVVLTGAGAAFAYWTNSGSGTGTAGTGTNVAVTVNQTTVVTGLYPGGSAVTLSGNFNNPNAGPTYVTAVTATGYVVDATHVTAGCATTGNYTLGGTAPVAANVPAGSNQGAWTGLTITMNNLGTNQDACKGATVTITYASS
ncbi:MAG: hypothetical protein ABIW17_10085 [Marmoricola sp.]